MPSFKICNSTDKEAVKQYIDKLLDSKVYDIDIKLHRTRRTIPQNNLFHMWCKCIQDDTGTDAEDVKRYCKEQFLGYKQNDIFGKASFELPLTSSLNTLQMSVFMNKVLEWASTELGITLPIPEDLIFTQFLNKYSDR